MDRKTDVSTPTGLMDFRAWIHELERTGNLVRIDDEIDTQTEAWAIMRYGNEQESPAQLFTNLKGAMPGSKLLGGPYATKERIAIAFGFPPDTSYSTLT
ncbi:MAG: hypothetical protein VW985_11220, partial [Gammaproteobacteria bacterium]